MTIFLGSASPNTILDFSGVDILGVLPIKQAFIELAKYGELAFEAWTHLQRHEWQLAIDNLDDLLKAEPNEAFLYFMRGYAYFHIADLEHAQSDLDKAIALDRDKALYHSFRGFVHLANNDFQKAEEQFDFALVLNKRFQLSYAGRGLARTQLKTYDAALKDLTQAIKYQQLSPIALQARGFVHVQNGRLSEALADFEQLARLRPNDPVVLNNQAFVLFQLNRLSQAERIWHKAATLAETLSFVKAGYSVTLWTLGKHESAALEFQEAIKLDPRWRDDLFEIASEFIWTMPMIEAARDILHYMVANTLRSGKYPRITSDPERLSGFPTIRGMRLSVETVARLALRGVPEQEILKLYPELEPEDITQAVAYAQENSLLVDIAA